MLRWIWDQLSRLWRRISSSAAELRRKISSAVASVRSFVRGLIAAARQTAVRLFNQAVAKATALFNVVKFLIASAKAFLLYKIQQAKDRVIAFFTPIITAVRSFINRQIAIIKARIELTKRAIKAWVNEQIAALRDTILRRLVELEEWLIEVRAILTAFADDPVGFIFAALSEFFLEWASFKIAYGLGTVNAVLPPMPEFGKGALWVLPVPGKGPPPGSGKLAMPLSHKRISGYTFGAAHPGVDFGCSLGAPVFAAHDARVTYTAKGSTGYGNHIVLFAGDWWTRYAHLSDIHVKVGDRIDARDAIGACGSTGNSSGPHLHFEVKFKGRYIDPLTVL